MPTSAETPGSRYAPTPRKSPDNRGGRAGQFTDARKQAANRLAMLSRGPEKKKSISKRSLAKLNMKVKISENEARKKKKAKPSVPEGSHGAHGLPPNPRPPHCFPQLLLRLPQIPAALPTPASRQH